MKLSLTVYSRWMAVGSICLYGTHNHPTAVGSQGEKGMGENLNPIQKDIGAEVLCKIDALIQRIRNLVANTQQWHFLSSPSHFVFCTKQEVEREEGS